MTAESDTQFTDHIARPARFSCPSCGGVLEALDSETVLLLVNDHLLPCVTVLRAEFANAMAAARERDCRELLKLREESAFLRKQRSQWAADLEGALARKARISRERAE